MNEYLSYIVENGYLETLWKLIVVFIGTGIAVNIIDIITHIKRR